MLNAWTIWWNAESLSHGLSDYWNAPIFAPELGTFAFSEPQPITLLLAPLVWLSGSPIGAYNAYLIASLALNGWFAARLLRRLGCHNWVQLCVGVAVVLHPLALRNVEAVQLLSIWASLWTITALLDLHRDPTWRSAACLGIAFAAQAAACLHHALFLAIILLATGWTVIPRDEYIRTWKALAVAGIVALCLLSPVVWPMRTIHSQHPLVRDPEVVASLSATWASWWMLPDSWLARAWLNFRGTESVANFPGPLLPGLVSALLATCVVACWLFGSYRSGSRSGSRQDFRLTVAVRLLFAIGLASWLFSFGPNVAWGTWNPWNALSEQFASLARVRSPYRFAYHTQMAILLLAGMGAEFVWRWGASISQSNRKGATLLSGSAIGLVCLSLLALAVEHVPGQCRLVYPPRVEQSGAKWVEFVAMHPAQGAVLCLPTAAGDSEAAHELSTRWMLYATRHKKPILNGYSGYTPRAWQQLNLELHRQGLTDAVLQTLNQLGCELIVVRREAGNFQEQLEQLSRLSEPRATKLYQDERFQVWRLAASG